MRCNKLAPPTHECAPVSGPSIVAATTLELHESGTQYACLATHSNAACFLAFAPPNSGCECERMAVTLPSRITCTHIASARRGAGATHLAVIGTIDKSAALWWPCTHVQALDRRGVGLPFQASACKLCSPKLLRGHKEAVTAATSLPGEAAPLAVTGSKDSTIRFWHAGAPGADGGLAPGHPLASLRGHGNAITDLRPARELGAPWAGRPEALVSSSRGKVILWDASKPACVSMLKTKHGVTHVLRRGRNDMGGCWGEACVVYSHAGGAACWDVRCAKKVAAHVDCVPPPRPSGAAACVHEHQVALPTAHGVSLHDVRRGSSVASCVHRLVVKGLSGLHVDGYKAVTAGHPGGPGRPVVVWDARTGHEVVAFGTCSDSMRAQRRAQRQASWMVSWTAPEDGEEDDAEGMTSADEGVGTLAANGPIVATVSMTGIVCAWDARGGAVAALAGGPGSPQHAGRSKFWQEPFREGCVAQ